MSIAYMTHEKKVKNIQCTMYNDIHLDWSLMFYMYISHPIDINYSDN